MADKVVVVGDIHYGRDPVIDSVISDRMNLIMDYMDKNGIQDLIQVGDLSDKRSGFNTEGTASIYDQFLTRFHDSNFRMVCTVGNHDCVFKSTNYPNTPMVLFKNTAKDRVVWTEAQEFPEFKDCVFVPWGCPIPENKPGYFVFGHFEISGFEMSRGIVDTRGLAVENLERYSKIFSGHYHRHCDRGNVVYVGSLVDLDFDSYNTWHGFYVLDLVTRKYEKVEFEDPIHIKIVYKGPETTLPDGDYSRNIVRIIRASSDGYEEFIKKVKAMNVYKLSEQYMDTDVQDIFTEEKLAEIEGPMDLMNEFLEKKTFGLDPNNLKSVARIIYNKAMEEV